ncbi:MAG: hypothetical protein FNP40_04980 [Dehalobacter sp. 4CP]|uniref:hypothetical protein n=1 Tax=Dehalobacter sp. CP TaxID=2594474 RepID=UPI0013C5430A|nr:hypothetical protein [Dehalobacter sp. 4CP]
MNATNYALICAVLLTVIFCSAGIYLLVLLRSARRTMQVMDSAFNTVRDTAAKAEEFIGEAQETLNVINAKLPEMVENLAASAANIQSVSETARVQLVDENEPGQQKKTGRFMFKGYSFWKKLKNH